MVSAEAVSRIGKLYAIEKYAQAANLPPEKIEMLRQEKSKTLLEELKIWLQSEDKITPPKGSLGKAIRYSLCHWKELIRYIEDGRQDIDNNRAERCIKPFVIGRKTGSSQEMPVAQKQVLYFTH